MGKVWVVGFDSYFSVFKVDFLIFFCLFFESENSRDSSVYFIGMKC